MQMSREIFVALCLLVVILSFYKSETLSRFYLNGHMTVVEPPRPSTSSVNRPMSVCSEKTRDELVNSPLQTMLHGNVNVTTFERSGCFIIDFRKTGLYRIVHVKNFGGVVCNHTQKRFLSSDEKGTRTALASVPGSGNTWTRHLLEEVTGIYTGSIYNDKSLRKVFPGEGHEENVIAAKTHKLPSMIKEGFNRAILVVRDPFEAARADYNRIKTMYNHTGAVKKENFNKGALIKMVNGNLMELRDNFNVKWINNFKGDMLVLFYEKLTTDLLNSLTKMASFTKSEVTLKKLWCILQNQEGKFHRRVPEWMSKEKLTNTNIENSIQTWKKAVYEAISNRTFGIASDFT